VQDLLAREREVLEQVVDVLQLALGPLQVLHDEVCPVAVGEGQRQAQVGRQLARLAGQHPRLVGLVDAADHHLELILELVLPADRRGVAFDDALQGHHQVVVRLVLDRQRRQLEVLVLRRVGQLVTSVMLSMSMPMALRASSSASPFSPARIRRSSLVLGW